MTFLLMLAASLTLAASPTPSGGAAQDMLNDPAFRKPRPDLAPKTGSAVTVGCSDQTGKPLQLGDEGYQECVSRAQLTTQHPTPGGAAQPRPNLNLKLGK